MTRGWSVGSRVGGVGVVSLEAGQVVDDDKKEEEQKDQDMGDGALKEEKKDAKEARSVGCGVYGFGIGDWFGELCACELSGCEGCLGR